ncbi:MAG: hypothetical protein CM15mP58_11770 [Burkholderiaceae bacterium]|nr:MAG: hypothetical protein CM15mP58_11770 [Burkholderiaceae bacterium]
MCEFSRNYGQSTALQAGFDHSTGDVLITMDGDLQNDPADIPKIIDVLKIIMKSTSLRVGEKIVRILY